jgi:putative component of membrane protein insertase Oxa1/YidC/SpoIIIJ protein YidD
MSTIAVAGIDLYRRYLSPLKGFRCAHHYVHGAGSCSTYGREVYATHGLIDATRLLRVRFAECRLALLRVKRTAIWHASWQDSKTDAEKRNRKGGNWIDVGNCLSVPGDCSGLGSCTGDAISGLDVCSCWL